jgi:hypothetical protein
LAHGSRTTDRKARNRLLRQWSEGIAEDAKAMIAAYMSEKSRSSETYDALLTQAKEDPDEYLTSLVCLGLEMLRRLSFTDPQHRSPETLFEDIGSNLAH